MAARPPANPPVLAVVPTPATPATVPTLGQQLRDVLQGRRLHSVSVSDHEANVLWLSEGALIGPDEHGLVIEGLQALAAEPARRCYETVLEDGRFGLLLPVRSPSGDLLGVAMVLADSKAIGDDTQERLMAAPVRAIMQRLAVLMKPGAPPAEGRASRGGQATVPAASTDDLTEEELALLELVPDIEPPGPPPRVQPAPRAAAAPAAPLQKPAAARAVVTPPAISPRQVDDILEFDLSPAKSPSPSPRRPTGSAARSKIDTQTDMMTLEFILEEPTAAPDAPSTAPAATAALAATGAPAPAAALAPPARSTAPAPTARPATSEAAAPRAAPAAAAVSAPRREAAPSAEPAADAAPQSDPHVALEVLPYVKLRSGGQTRRFQIQARLSPRAAQCDPAVLDLLIVQRVVGWLAAHRTVWNSQPTSFSINLSIATLEDERFAHKVSAELNAHGIAAETLGFEIAEALATQRRAQVERFIAQCDKLGTPVVIDDFSFDSQVLPLLRSKAVRLVKIDPRLTASALKDKFCQALVVATVQAAKVLGIHCAAKRVETQAAAQWLGAIGCDLAQGAALSGTKSLETLLTSPDATGLTTHANRQKLFNDQ